MVKRTITLYSQPGPQHKANWSLISGTLLVILIVFAALLGPQIAPHDPVEEHTIIRVNDQWITPPFKALEVPGYLLGSDMFGRDLLSRLLWGIGPTLAMVATVAAVRLFLGVYIGLLSGWFENNLGRVLTTLTSVALSLPVLIVALIAIAAIGVELGISAFIIGLSISGWAETAQVIREKTREIKREQYIEAGHALGASNAHNIFGHVLRHVMPMIWMRFAFEISNTLMLTASLGFLGYFIGGDVWIEVGDFVARKVSGKPELGQMLATSQSNLLEPWGMFAVGSTIFITVLGFNLLGEGLRRRLALNRAKKRTLYGWVLSEGIPWLDEKLRQPFKRWSKRSPWLAGATTLLVLSSVVALTRWITRPVQPDNVALPMPQHLWAMERHDPYGTFTTAKLGPQQPHILWTFEVDSFFDGGPAIDQDGNLYLGARDTAFYALNPAGQVLWNTTMPTSTVGTPALSDSSILYVSDVEGGINALSLKGELLWRHVPDIQRKPANGPIIGPDGTIYSGFGSNLQAVAADGTPRWHTATPYGYHETPPLLSADGRWLIREDLVVDAQSGTVIEWPTLEGIDALTTGADGQQYLLSGDVIMRWNYTDDDVEITQSAMWDSQVFTFFEPHFFGAHTDNTLWLLYTSNNNNTQVWLHPDGKLINMARAPISQRSTLVGLDAQLTAYVCGNSQRGNLICAALGKSSPDPLWELDTETELRPQAGAVVPGRIYLTTKEGVLYAIGDE